MEHRLGVLVLGAREGVLVWVRLLVAPWEHLLLLLLLLLELLLSDDGRRGRWMSGWAALRLASFRQLIHHNINTLLAEFPSHESFKILPTFAGGIDGQLSLDRLHGLLLTTQSRGLLLLSLSVLCLLELLPSLTVGLLALKSQALALFFESLRLGSLLLLLLLLLPQPLRLLKFSNALVLLLFALPKPCLLFGENPKPLLLLLVFLLALELRLLRFTFQT